VRVRRQAGDRMGLGCSIGKLGADGRTVPVSPRNDRENWAYYLARGRCPRCSGARMVVPGKKLCEVCAKARNEYLRQRRALWVSEGRCSQCGGELTDGKFRTCEKCRNGRGAKRSEYLREQRARRREEGICTECGKTWAEPGKSMCKACLEALRERERRNDPDHARKYALRKARIDAGLCIDCGRKTVEGRTRCERCREMRRDSERKYRIHQRTLKKGVQGWNTGK